MRLSRSYLSIARSGLRKRAFSLIELMVAVSLTSFIIIVLYQVFNQTQKALRSSLKQVNVQELGAPAMELLSSDLQSAIPFSPFDPHGTNMEIRLAPLAFAVHFDTSNPDPAKQADILRTNIVQDLWFLRRDKQMWVPTMYRLTGLFMTNEGNVFPIVAGTLTRFTTNIHASTLLQNNEMLTNFYPNGALADEQRWPKSMVSKVAERVVHFKVTAFDGAGRPYTYQAPTNYSRADSRVGSETYRYYSADSPQFSSNVVTRLESREMQVEPRKDYIAEDLWFRGRAMPAAIEIEIGIIEQETYDQYRLMAAEGPGMGLKFFAERPNAVHVFRKRIPVVSGLRDERLVVTK